MTYQGAPLTCCSEGRAYMQLHKYDYADSVVDCLVGHLKMQHTDLLTDILAILASQGWEKEENAERVAPLSRFIGHFEYLFIEKV